MERSQATRTPQAQRGIKTLYIYIYIYIYMEVNNEKESDSMGKKWKK